MAAEKHSSLIQWISFASMTPDPDIETIIALDDGEVCGGVWDGSMWRYDCGVRIEDREVLWWADFPLPPQLTILIG